MSCPHLRNEPYEGSRLGAQLDDQSKRFLSSRSRLKITRMDKVIHLSPIFKWFAQDFLSQYVPKQAIGKHSKANQAVLQFVASYLDEPFRKFVLAGDYKIKYLDYDWSLNEQK
jgi:predicted hydrolase (HD superfamily)